MATYALVHGASSDSWYWHLVVPELRRRGHDVVAPDLPSDDDRYGFEEYAAAVVDSIGARRDVVLVAQSLGGFTAPLVCERVPVRLLVLVAAMVPMPGEAPGAYAKIGGNLAQFIRRGRLDSTESHDGAPFRGTRPSPLVRADGFEPDRETWR